MRNGIDCSAHITKSVADKLVALGHTFAARYLVPSVYSKWLSPDEAKVISDAGLDILSVFETTASRCLSGAGGGRTDGAIAARCAKAVKQPEGSAIYFAVDFDVTQGVQYDKIAEYLKGCAETIGNYAIGVYGEYSVIEEMFERGVVKHGWQTYAWSGGKRSSKANVYQFKNGQSVAGITVDLNNSFGNEGFWNLRSEKKALTKFPDVPAGHWAEKAIADSVAAGILVGYTDGTFGLEKPVTREELAVVIQKLLKGAK